MAKALTSDRAPETRAGRGKRWAKRLLRLLVTSYVFIAMLGYFAQDWLAFPGITSQGKAETAVHYGNSAELLHLSTAGGIPIVAVFGIAPGSVDAARCPTILYFYGNAGSVAWSQNEFDHMRELGANVMIPDLAGFGASGGKASEQNFYATADACWEYLAHRPGVDPARIVVVGWSMGAGVAIDLAHRKSVAGVATFNAFTDLPSMAHQLFPWLPTSLLLKYRFDNLTKIREIRCPTLICNGDLDALIAPDMSDHLASASGGPVTRLHVATADHNTIFVAEPKVVWPALGRLVDQIREK